MRVRCPPAAAVPGRSRWWHWWRTGDAASGRGGAVTWASWANPGEAERFRQFSKDYQSQHDTKITYQIVTGDYNSKLLTQLAGGSAPDAFYVSTEGAAK